MSGTETPLAQTGGNNASEFVRKLFRMLEDPSHQDVARWGKEGDSFVVVEGEKFTRSILPRHFKHSNMSSFVRQLNKYDFHKVKPSGDAESVSPNGNILEFKHPYFRADSKDGLDNIRRKAPAPRKVSTTDDFTTSHHVGVISEQLTATQQQVQQLQELYSDVSQTNRLLVNEVLGLQKMVNVQKQAQLEMLNYLTPYNDGRSRGLINQPLNSNDSHDVDEAVPELRRARELLSSVTTDPVTDRELERLHGTYESPNESAAMITPVSMPILHDSINDLGRYPVYPVGQTVGIDPFHSDHVKKIPYAMPNEGTSMGVSEAPSSAPPQAPATATSAPSTPMDKLPTLWGQKKPLVFLVEDDSTCAKIGIKFLKSMGCDVEHALAADAMTDKKNGVEAYSRVNNVGRDHFDMVFMDIIMPRLDGVSATMYIRQHCPSTPIIAMTSNIRPDEVNGYFEHGMNGVLAKPFTKEGMLKSVKTHMAHLLKSPSSQAEGEGVGYMLSNVSFLTNSVKFETPTPPPGASGPSWSPGQMGQSSVDQCYGLMNGGGQYNIGRPHYGTGMDTTPKCLSEQDSPPEKRQRLGVPQGNYG